MKPRVFCSHCNAELRWGDKFCGNCGKPVEFSDDAAAPPQESVRNAGAEPSTALGCRTCGTVNKPGSEFCKNCGADLRSQISRATGQIPGTGKQGKAGERKEKKEVRPLPFLSSWKPVAAVVVIIVAAIALEMYSTKPSIPTDVAPQQTQQQPAGANMAALQQIQDMEQQVKANPGNAEMVLNLANVLSDNRFYDKAITYYNKYLEKKPNDANARVDLGICYKETGAYDNAVGAMKKALEVDPKHLFATFNLGIVMLDEAKTYMDQGQMDKANELIKESNDWFKKTVALAPTSEVGKRAQQLLTQHSSTQLPQSN